MKKIIRIISLMRRAKCRWLHGGLMRVGIMYAGGNCYTCRRCSEKFYVPWNSGRKAS